MRPRKKQLIHPDKIAIIKQIFKGFLAISAVVLLLVGIWHGTRVQSLTINTVTVTGGETISHEIIKKTAELQLEGTYFGLIPKRFAWLYPKSDIERALRDIKRVHNISVVREYGTTITITFDEYIPYALWCQSTESDECLFIDQTGLAFAEAPVLNGGSFLRLITIDKEMKVLETVSSIERLNSIFELVTLLSEQEWFVSKVELDRVGDAFLHLTGGGELKVALSVPATDVVENLLVVLASPEFSHLNPGNFSYIDLRFGEKVFVNEIGEVPETETATSSDEAVE